MEDLRTALASALEAGVSGQAAMLYDWLVHSLAVSEGHAAAVALAEDGIEFARSRGLRSWLLMIRRDRLAALFAAGAWSGVMAEAEELIEEARAGESYPLVVVASIEKVAVLSLRGEVEEAGELARGFLELEADPHDSTVFVVPRARSLREAGHHEAAIDLLEEWVGLFEKDDFQPPYFSLQTAAREAIALGLGPTSLGASRRFRYSRGRCRPLARRQLSRPSSPKPRAFSTRRWRRSASRRRPGATSRNRTRRRWQSWAWAAASSISNARTKLWSR